MKTPDMKPREMLLNLEYVNRVLGMDFSKEEVKKHLERMRFDADVSGEKIIKVLIPAYRGDILNQIDLVEDVAISYGYDKFQPLEPKLSTYGSGSKAENFAKNLRELMIGLGFQEITTLILTNERDLFARMNVPKEKTTETENSVSAENAIARTWLLPSLMKILEHNKNREYPQKIFEIGECITAQGENSRKLSGVIAHSTANFSEMKASTFGILENLGLQCKVQKFSHSSFIPGRCASLEFGFFGELHPKVLKEFSLEVPVTAFEMDLNAIYKKIR